MPQCRACGKTVRWFETCPDCSTPWPKRKPQHDLGAAHASRHGIPCDHGNDPLACRECAPATDFNGGKP